MSEQEQNLRVHGPGAALKARREELGLDVDYVATQLKLSQRQIDSIESDRFDQLPGNTFARGFVRNYARMLQLDPAPIMADLESRLPHERTQAALPHVAEESSAFNLSSGSGSGGRWMVGLGFVVAFIGAVGAILWYLQQPASPELATSGAAASAVALETPPAIASDTAASDSAAATVASATTPAAPAALATAATPTPAPAATPTPKPAATPTPAPAVVASAPQGEGPVRLIVAEDSWVQITDANGTRLVGNLLKSGTDRSFAGTGPYRIKIGNAPGTKLYLHGQEVDLAPYIKNNVATLELK
ncbi:helix-turn-helix domain-containing protein [Amantichitinum ursilacus]|uniref:Cytoskeleton protein RodZ n=1 Tax=Amantichitinum ursilacus TaxID=857265 RepID=A0A0N0GNB6_9NEIS|nr:helix-turn-helix domain-containing protein [Amantichitinum ursilacus]KPC52664.1 Cytoskeleton protein RodZ [Amantichitinum ursilacus]